MRRSRPRLRHPAEVPFFIFMVVLNVLIIAAILDAAAVLPFLPDRLEDTGWATAVRAALIALLLLVPGLIVVREVQRASTRGTAVQLSPRQYPDLYRTAEEFAPPAGTAAAAGDLPGQRQRGLERLRRPGHRVRLRRAVQRAVRQSPQPQSRGLGFILGHELGHIRLHHVSLWYQLAVAYSQLIPLLGPTLSRLCEYSCDRHGAYLSPLGATVASVHGSPP
jgi:hypothetical protein